MSRIPVSCPALAALAVAGLVLAACAPAPSSADGASSDGARACFFTRQVSGFSEGARRDGRIYLRTGVNEAFEVETFGACNEIDWTLSVGIDSTFGGPTTCVGDSIRLVVPSPGRGADRCLARVTRKLTDAERETLLND